MNAVRFPLLYLSPFTKPYQKTLSLLMTKCFNFYITKNRSPLEELRFYQKTMRAKGVEPLHLAALDPKSSASANSATPAHLILEYNNRKSTFCLVLFYKKLQEIFLKLFFI